MLPGTQLGINFVEEPQQGSQSVWLRVVREKQDKSLNPMRGYAGEWFVCFCQQRSSSVVAVTVAASDKLTLEDCTVAAMMSSRVKEAAWWLAVTAAASDAHKCWLVEDNGSAAGLHGCNS